MVRGSCEEGLNRIRIIICRRIITRARTELLWVASSATGLATADHFNVGVSCSESNEIWIVFMPSLRLHFCRWVGERLRLALLGNLLECGHVVRWLSQAIAHSLQVGELVKPGISLIIIIRSTSIKVIATADVFNIQLSSFWVRIWHTFVFKFHVAAPLRWNLPQLLLWFWGSMSMILWWYHHLILLYNCLRLFHSWHLIDNLEYF